jgi:threonine/homoserine/homoserine lactone efflux protein
MPPLDLLWAYLLAILVLTLTPGVDTLVVVRNTARGGVYDGGLTSLGVCSGLFIHATLSAVGISLILVQTAWAFTLLKWAGAAYLVWLGLSSLYQAARTAPAVSITATGTRSLFGVGRSFREGLLSNVLNPKTALFYMAFLPQFIDPAGSAFGQSIVLAALHFIMAMVWQCGLAVIVARSRGFAMRPGLNRLMHGLTGGIFVALGARVALTQP